MILFRSNCSTGPGALQAQHETHAANTDGDCSIMGVKAAKTKKKFKRKIVESKFVFACESAGKCYQTFESMDAMNYHVSTYHAKGVKKTVICYLCEKTYTFRKDLQKHVISAHTRFRHFNCPFPMCLSRYNQYSNLKRHISTVHANSDTFKCSKCPKIFYRKVLLKHHMADEHGTGVHHHRCHLCNGIFAHGSSLRTHINTVHNCLKLFSCQIATCSKAFTTNHSLKSHINAIHTKKIVFGCTECSFRSHYKNSLSNHMVIFHGNGANAPN